MKITFITWNKWKLKEIQTNISSRINLVSQDIDIMEIQSQNLEEISKNKAKQAFEKIWEAVLVDDTGVFFNYYPDFPWAFAKFVYKSLWKDWIKKLFDWVQDNTWSMQTAISYMDWNLSEPVCFLWIAEWKFETHHLDQVPNDSLPYNYIFVPNWYTQTVTENYEYWQKNLSQRKKAIEKFNKWISKFI